MKDRIAALLLGQRHQFDTQHIYQLNGTAGARARMYEEMTEKMDELFFKTQMAVIHVRGEIEHGNLRCFIIETGLKFFHKYHDVRVHNYDCKSVASVIVSRVR